MSTRSFQEEVVDPGSALEKSFILVLLENFISTPSDYHRTREVARAQK